MTTADDGRIDLSPPEDTDVSADEETQEPPPDGGTRETSSEEETQEETPEVLVWETPQDRRPDVFVQSSELHGFLDDME